MIRKLINLTFAALLTGVVVAQDVSVRSDHPDSYVVVKGDTLWDIAGRFLDQPWQWPAIWHANPQVANPHLIYPGDVLSLVYVDGVPQLRVARTDKLSPQVRVVERDDPINAIPLDRIEPFLRDVRVLSPSEFEGLPYIVANNEARLTATYTDHTYARGLRANVGDEFVVARLHNIYDRVDAESAEIRRVQPRPSWQQVANVKDRNETLWNETDPWHKRPQNPVGYEMVVVSQVRVRQTGEISVLDVVRDRTEVRPGDFILPLDSRGYDSTFFPHAMDSVPDGMRILGTKDALYGVGHYQIVSLNGGSRQGVESGHVFSVFRPGPVVKDRTGYRHGSFDANATVRMPADYHALVMVFRTFDDISYAMVMAGQNVVREFDHLRHPSERL